MCKSQINVCSNNSERNVNNISSLFVGNVNSSSSDPWITDITLQNRNPMNKLKFMIDSGSDVTCIPAQEYKKIMGKMRQNNAKTSDPVGENLNVCGSFTTKLIFEKKTG